jgi:hypothetical protein
MLQPRVSDESFIEERRSFQFLDRYSSAGYNDAKFSGLRLAFEATFLQALPTIKMKGRENLIRWVPSGQSKIQRGDAIMLYDDCDGGGVPVNLRPVL